MQKFVTIGNMQPTCTTCRKSEFTVCRATLLRSVALKHGGKFPACALQCSVHRFVGTSGNFGDVIVAVAFGKQFQHLFFGGGQVFVHYFGNALGVFLTEQTSQRRALRRHVFQLGDVDVICKRLFFVAASRFTASTICPDTQRLANDGKLPFCDSYPFIA